MAGERGWRVIGMQFDDYKALIDCLAEAGYTFRTFSESSAVHSHESNVILRHDIDFSLALAARMAAWEAQNGMRTSYFAQARSPLYNVIAQQSCEQLAAIAECGHDIGLHFDPSLYQIIEPVHVARETGILQLAVPSCLTTLTSLHRPRRSLSEIQKWTGRIGIHTTYDEPWTTAFLYFSDSRGRWANGSPLDSSAFHERRNLHILVHPLWWLEAGETPAAQLRSFAGRAENATLQQLRESAVSIDI
ncbi:hypothetical protein [Actinoallomurus sp. CA-150999]|uniref:hypothetical protein n=1 Tax=Actinoallomurus sp. CA-150999 TaxID=3239887 RepID=UPI003D8C7167